MDQILYSRKRYYFFLIFLLLLTLLPILFFLDVDSIRLWDESRQAWSAVYMLVHKNYLVTYFNNEPDLWNTKPPLLVWLQMLSMQLFGVNEFAVRFPVMVAVLLTAWLIFWFGWHILKLPVAAVFGVLVLIGSRGYMGHHVALTGDYDGLLTFFITTYSFFFFRFLETPRQKYWFIITTFLILAALTKGVAAILPLPALVVYAVLTKKIPLLLRSKGFYLGLLAFIIVVGGFYFWREQISPGYWQAVRENELGGRFLNTLEEHQKPWYYFFVGGKFMPWLILLPVCLFFIYKFSEGIARRFSLFAVCYYVIFIFIISSARTKLPWYDAPTYPIISLVVGIGLSLIFERLQIRFPQRKKLVTFLFALLFLVPYSLLAARAFEQRQKDKTDPIAALGYFLKAFNDKFPEQKNYTILTAEGYHSPLDFYVLKYSLEGDDVQQRRIENQTKELQPGQVIITTEAPLKNALLSEYRVTKMYESEYGLAVEILALKK